MRGGSIEWVNGIDWIFYSHCLSFKFYGDCGRSIDCNF